MINKIMKYFDRNTIICMIVTSIILCFYTYIILYIYMLSLILVIIIRYKWNIVNIKKLNSAVKNIALSTIAIFIIIILGEIWLHLYPHRFTGIGGLILWESLVIILQGVI